MGGLIAAHVAFRDPGAWAAVVLSGPATRIGSQIDDAPVAPDCAHGFKALPKLAVRSLDIDLISGNRPVVELAKQDPFRVSVPLTARYGAEMMRAIDDVWKNMERSTFPLLIVHGSKDLLCAVGGSRRVMELAFSTDKRLIEYEGLMHEVLTEVTWRRVLSDIQGFLDGHCLSR
ncbi:putative monoglyceride lipase [Trypanosoma cruzi]|uniref:Putative monoglyceride lipase n=1 Tax=Trypanosoma cruzi TaxID=5693 RepID=A0A2V2UYH9_TRYCR|nr:putative monoglyceride lipase [Trypanosoma cruzi]